MRSVKKPINFPPASLCHIARDKQRGRSIYRSAASREKHSNVPTSSSRRENQKLPRETSASIPDVTRVWLIAVRMQSRLPHGCWKWVSYSCVAHQPPICVKFHFFHFCSVCHQTKQKRRSQRRHFHRKKGEKQPVPWLCEWISLPVLLKVGKYWLQITAQIYHNRPRMFVYFLLQQFASPGNVPPGTSEPLMRFSWLQSRWLINDKLYQGMIALYRLDRLDVCSVRAAE